MIVLDLRERNEVERRSLLIESINIPVYSHYQDAVNYVMSADKEEEFLLLCSSGNRAEMFRDKLPKEFQERCNVFKGTISQFNMLISEHKKI